MNESRSGDISLGDPAEVGEFDPDNLLEGQNDSGQQDLSFTRTDIHKNISLWLQRDEVQRPSQRPPSAWVVSNTFSNVAACDFEILSRDDDASIHPMQRVEN